MTEPRLFATPGHCIDIDGACWHPGGFGTCEDPHTHPCCGYVETAVASEAVEVVVSPDVHEALRRRAEEIVARFRYNLGFTAPEMYDMRFEQLRDEIETALFTTLHEEGRLA